MAAQVMKRAAELGLKSYTEEHGMPAQSKQMLERKMADGLNWILAQPIIDEKEVRAALSQPHNSTSTKQLKPKQSKSQNPSQAVFSTYLLGMMLSGCLAEEITWVLQTRGLQESRGSFA
jgi:hypothetical protein